MTPGGRSGIQMAAFGFEMAGSVVGALLLGSVLDEYFGTEPWLTLFCVVAGATLGLSRLVELARRLDRHRTSRSEDGSGDSPARRPPERNRKGPGS